MKVKKVNISVSVDQEKSNAIKFYMAKKDSSLQAELDEFMGKLYEKYVPLQTREYIESISGEAKAKTR